MGAFDRFRKLEGPRPERKGPELTQDDVAARFGQPEMPADPAEAAPINCAKCGGDNQARSERCYNCGAELDTPEMREHQERYRAKHLEEQQHAAERREERKREAEAAVEREVEKLRQSSTTTESQSAAGSSSDSWPGNMPIAWLWRAVGRIPDPPLRLGLQIAIVAGFVALVGFGVSAPNRYGLLLLAGILIGGGGVRGRYGRYGLRRRGWWW